jgi:hypothetical protein
MVFDRIRLLCVFPQFLRFWTSVNPSLILYAAVHPGVASLAAVLVNSCSCSLSTVASKACPSAVLLALSFTPTRGLTRVDLLFTPAARLDAVRPSDCFCRSGPLLDRRLSTLHSCVHSPELGRRQLGSQTNGNRCCLGRWRPGRRGTRVDCAQTSQQRRLVRHGAFVRGQTEEGRAAAL